MTAVQFLVNHLTEYGFNLKLHKIEIEQAKELEKQQIIDAYEKGFFDERKGRNIDAEQYYTETYEN